MGRCENTDGCGRRVRERAYVWEEEGWNWVMDGCVLSVAGEYGSKRVREVWRDGLTE